MMNATTTTVTPLELVMPLTGPDSAVWTDCTMEAGERAGITKRAHGGVCSSMSQKGLARFQGSGRDAVCWLTEAGLAAISEAVRS